MEPTNNAAAGRTWNVKNLSAQGDYAKYNPWRAPGHSIPLNGCGVASGFLTGGFERVGKTGQKSFYQSAVPTGYKAGDPGTKVPELKSIKTVWTAGGTAEVMFAIDVNHGGGYQYRLCPKGIGGINAITEDCFQQNPLAFATKNHIIRYSDGSRTDLTIPAVEVTEGVKPAGAAWRRFPVPSCNCDLGTGCAATKQANTNLYKGQTATWAYATETAESGCPTGLQFPKSWDEGFGYYGPNHEVGKNADGKSGGEADGKKDSGSSCHPKHTTEDTCKTDTNCTWTDFGAKGFFCWEGGKKRRLEADEDHEHHDHHDHRMLAVGDGTYRCPVCGYIYDPKAHGGTSFEKQPSTYKCPVCNTVKTRFKPSSEYSDEVGTAPANGYRWHIVDKVVVPSTPGGYVLSWRWDCEQTPQIWTNCADIEIQAPAAAASSSHTLEPSHGFLFGAVLMAYGFATAK